MPTLTAMPAYPIPCQACPALAEFKIAARWSDGDTHELKTYALACAACLPTLLAAAKAKQSDCHMAPNETLEPPGVYDLRRNTRDRQLARRPDLEG